MTVRLLIDGYNLLFTAGFEGRGRGRGWLERARLRLVKHLEAHLPQDEHSHVVVVFDASREVFQAKSVKRSELVERKAEPAGIQVLFASGFDEADDLLEQLIRKHATPKALTVVSSDHRIRKCAIARRAVSIDSDSFLDRLEKPTKDSPIAENLAGTDIDSARTKRTLSNEEVAEWLHEFGEDV